jgi:hypothetical protein
MPTDRPNPPDDDLAVRLQWPSDPSLAPDTDRSAAPWPSAPEDGETRVHTAEVVAGDPSGPGRTLIEAYDRLGDRVLERMRALREDIDADLSAVRSELASLRQAVDDVGDRVQLRQLRATLDELRSDVTGLRRAVIEWPELEQVSSDIAGLRSDMTEVIQAVRGGDPAAPSIAALGPLVEELAELRGEVTSLRRRITLRGGSSAPPLDEEQLARLADQVADRIAASGSRSRRR